MKRLSAEGRCVIFCLPTIFFMVAEIQGSVAATMVILTKNKSKVMRIYGLAVSEKNSEAKAWPN